MAFKRSDDIYTDTVTLNSMAAKSSMDSEIVRLEESKAESRAPTIAGRTTDAFHAQRECKTTGRSQTKRRDSFLPFEPLCD